jgi:hypothetical protein
MADGAKVVINLATGLEDPERVTVAFLVGGAAAEQGKQVAHVLDQGSRSARGPRGGRSRCLRRLPAARQTVPAVRRQGVRARGLM